MASKSKQKPKLSGLHTVHAAGIFSDMTVDGPEIGTLIVVVDRAKNLPDRKIIGKQNPYCAARLGKEAKKTDTDHRGGQTPKWDQELRYTVHDSPDYYQLKVSVFNDDKKTDLIGETKIDLRDIIVPGGGQNDVWHQLLFKAKYAGEIRARITYFDMRPVREMPRKPVQIKDSNVVIRTTISSESLQSLRAPDEVSKIPSTFTISPATEIKFSPEKKRFFKNEYEASINVDCSKDCTRSSNEKSSFHDTSEVTFEWIQNVKNVANDELNESFMEVSKTAPKNISQLAPRSHCDTLRNRSFRSESRERSQYRYERTPRNINFDSLYKYPSTSSIDAPPYQNDSPPPTPPIHRSVNTNNHLSFDQIRDSPHNLISHRTTVFHSHFGDKNPEVTQVPHQNPPPHFNMAPYSSRTDDQIYFHQYCSAEQQREKLHCLPKENYQKVSSQANNFGPRQHRGNCESSFL
ncbi:putative c2 domain containing protein [Erysiphe neolycopersici]|uniref:Putative c2 domain containing protein n=1 Tax=Erysiphe neolycopersici TaxID=212602 RepID=A0A420HVV0_9PEZI|nr:putative c2 domain containing protein [Erysiphe neolycopersici]